MTEIPVRFHPAAAEEVENARSWYAERNASVAAAFRAELDRAILAISGNPLRWPRSYDSYRRFPMRAFPFNIIYAARPDFVEVMAVAHYRRKPGYWISRQ
ncbi:MAG: type II toxin-antitoxin system RelE/ParE family toxin [Gammaproteobacteria bacterium PRO9]|nr:type II toxin-antitoxin system RelE/ParE family toxin [Gammaproteobacteria bacterium PRO9]